MSETPSAWLPDTVTTSAIVRPSSGGTCGPAGVLHIPKQAGAQITVDDFLPFDPLLTPRAKIIYDTGWQRQFGQDHSFTELPSMPLKAARYIASKESRLLGMDTPTLSRDPDEVHHILLGQEVVIVESLADLDHVPAEFYVYGLPAEHRGARRLANQYNGTDRVNSCMRFHCTGVWTEGATSVPDLPLLSVTQADRDSLQ